MLNFEEVARILYNMSSDMDCADYAEQAEEEISCLEKELQILEDNNCKNLLKALETIAMENME